MKKFLKIVSCTDLNNPRAFLRKKQGGEKSGIFEFP